MKNFSVLEITNIHAVQITCRRAMNRKNTLEYLLNCSNKNFGRNVMKLYLAVLKNFKKVYNLTNMKYCA